MGPGANPSQHLGASLSLASLSQPLGASLIQHLALQACTVE